jgi:hypothetical protein
VTLAVGPFAMAASLLVAGGVAKALRPTDTANALRIVGLPGSTLLVRVGACAEALVGAAALTLGDSISAALVAVSYLAFAVFVFVALRSGSPIASCGCFGRADTPPSALHVGINLAAVAAAMAVVFTPNAGLAHVLREQPLAGVPFLLLVTCGAAFTYLALSSLPRSMALVRHSAGGGGGQ